MKAPMDRKKLTLYSLVILSFAFLGWQVYQLVSTDIGAENPKPTVSVTHVDSASANRLADASLEAQPTLASLKTMPKPMRATSETQQAYLDLMHKLEIVRMQRRLLDEEAGVAAAKERIATLNHHTAELSASGANVTTVSMPLATGEGFYRLAYLDQQNGHWSATVLKNNRYQEAELGSELADGSRVIAIDDNGLVLEQNDHKRLRLTFSGLIPLPAESLAPEQTDSSTNKA